MYAHKRHQSLMIGQLTLIFGQKPKQAYHQTYRELSSVRAPRQTAKLSISTTFKALHQALNLSSHRLILQETRLHCQYGRLYGLV